MKINFYIQTEDSERAPIYIRLTDGRRCDLRVKTDQVINTKLWDGAKWKPGKVRGGKMDAALKPQAAKVSERLKEIDSDLTTKYNGTKNKLHITKDWLNNYFRRPATAGTDGQAAPMGLVPYFDFYGQAKGSELGKASHVKLNVVKHLLEKMQADENTAFDIPDIDETFMKRFRAFSVRRKYATNTTARNWTFIKTICFHAAANGIQVNANLKNLSLKKERADKVYLTLDELDKIEVAEMPQDYLDNSRDWLLISCEVGQRVSDFLNFLKDMIRHDGNKALIEFRQKKTGKAMSVPLSKRVRRILEKRGGEFPRKISDQRYNEYIKEVCRLSGIDAPTKGSIQNPETERKEKGVFPKYRLVTSHIGRRSFATNNYGKIPTSLLIGATGHGTEQMFLEYIGKTDQEKALQLAEYF